MAQDPSIERPSNLPPPPSFFKPASFFYSSFHQQFCTPTFLLLLFSYSPHPPNKTPATINAQTFARRASASFSGQRSRGMNNSYSSINEENLAEGQLTQPVHIHPDPNSNIHHHTSYGSHHPAARTLSIDRDDSGPAATAITVNDDTNKAPPSYAMDSPRSPPRVGGKQVLNRFRTIANRAVAARRLSCKD